VAATAPAAPQDWRHGQAQVFLSTDGPVQNNATAYFSGNEAYEVRVAINSLMGAATRVTLGCDGTAHLRGTAPQGLFMRPGARRQFSLPGKSHGEVVLALSPEVENCTLKWGAGRQMALRRLESARPILARLQARQDVCTPPDPARMDALEAAFYADRWLAQSCSRSVAPPRLLYDPLKALNARFEALTGAPADPAALMRGDPNMAIDFSHAPRLRMIYVSYLLVRADYSGALLRRLLAWHAAQGTIVRIFLSNQLVLAKDRALFEALAARYPSVQIQYFKWSRPGLNDGEDVLNREQRTHHIKLFATLAERPGQSVAIIGGRNLWDGYFFDAPFDLSAYGQLRDYQPNTSQGLLYHSVYRDFEVELREDAAVADMIALLSTWWMRDAQAQVARPLAVNGPAQGGPGQRQARFFLSAPWADGQALEGLYVDLFDAAQHDITMVSPYTYPTPKILAALLRARGRGVHITIVTRVHSTDPPGQSVSALNHIFMARWNQYFDIYQRETEGPLLHTKLVLIDGRFSIVGSVNLNRRSFVHDTEDGVMLLDRTTNAGLRKVVALYLETSHKYDPGEAFDFLDRLMQRVEWLWQYY